MRRFNIIMAILASLMCFVFCYEAFFTGDWSSWLIAGCDAGAANYFWSKRRGY